LLAHGRWFSPGTPASSTTKTGRHDIAESGVKTPKINKSIKSIQHYVIKFISDLRQVRGFLWVLLFSPPIKLTAMI
jgi:hypothetical protein